MKNVDAYIAKAPQMVRGKLSQLRKIIRDSVPDAEEKISYAMPYYGYKGRLAYFAFSKNHIGLYIPHPVVRDHKSELEGYVTAASTVRFPLDKAIPTRLVAKLLKARAKLNDMKEAKRNRYE